MKLISVFSSGHVCRFVFGIINPTNYEDSCEVFILDFAFPFDLHIETRDSSLYIQDNFNNKSRISPGMSTREVKKIISRFQGIRVEMYDFRKKRNEEMYQAKLQARQRWYERKKNDPEWLDNWREYHRKWMRSRRELIKKAKTRS